MEKLTLHEFKNQNIRISMKICFNEKGQLLFVGHDMGEMVEKLWGKPEYEYFYTVETGEVRKIAGLLGVDSEDKRAVLTEIKKRFNGNDAYSKFGSFMSENDIVFDRFSC